MSQVEEKIKAIEEEIKRTPYNKATQHHIGRLKAQLAQLRELKLKEKKSGRGKGRAGIKKSGDAVVAIVGFPNVGKSTLLNQLTGARSKVGGYDFTTLNVIPGILLYRGLKIQLLDVPGIISGAAEGRGRGREILSIVRNADLLLILIDAFNPQQLEIVKSELYKAGLRLNKKPPNVSITPRKKGGVEVIRTFSDQKLEDRAIREILNTYGIHNAEVILRENVDEEEFIDAVAGNRVYLPMVVAVNKVDLIEKDYLEHLRSCLTEPFIPISAEKRIGLDELKNKIVEKLEVIRVYLKSPGSEIDWKEPLVLRPPASIKDVCKYLHKDFLRKFRYARVWGKSVKYQGQQKGLEHILQDGDVVMLVKEN